MGTFAKVVVALAAVVAVGAFVAHEMPQIQKAR